MKSALRWISAALVATGVSAAWSGHAFADVKIGALDEDAIADNCKRCRDRRAQQRAPSWIGLFRRPEKSPPNAGEYPGGRRSECPEQRGAVQPLKSSARIQRKTDGVWEVVDQAEKHQDPCDDEQAARYAG